MTGCENESIRLSDGRTLSYAVYGSPVPRTTIIYMHGFPSSRFEGKLWHSVCARRGIRIITPDRPGSGRSTFQKNRRLLDWPADIVALADQLKINQFYTLGVSGGCPYALACLKAIPPERILGAAVASGSYPHKLGTEGMMLMNRILFWIGPWLPGLTAFLFERMIGRTARDKDEKILDDMLHKEVANRPPKDRDAILEPAVWPVTVDMTREAFRQPGSEGQAWEAKLNGSDWGFELSQLNVGDAGVPLTLWHGTEDVHVPVGMAKKANDLIPGSVLRLKQGEGHVSFIFRDVDEILDDLMGKSELEEYIKVGEEG